jgi:formate C-acetyltransferase
MPCRHSRRRFLANAGAVLGGASWVWATRGVSDESVRASHPDIEVLRRAVVDAPVRVARHRGETFTRVFQQYDSDPWVLRKARALREYFLTVPLYVREHDLIAGSLTESPGAMPVMAELGIAENGIYTSERPDRRGYLEGQVSAEVREYWKNHNMWGQHRTEILGQDPYASSSQVPRNLHYKFLSNQGHLSPSYGEVLQVGLGGMCAKVRTARQSQTRATADQLAFWEAAEQVLTGLSEWIGRYRDDLSQQADRCGDARRAEALREMARIAAQVMTEPPGSFREALQLLWFIHQAIHIEGHGYSCTPDRPDQLLWPYYAADRAAGRLTDADVVRLTENLVLKMYDNGFWGSEHHLTQGLCLGGSTPEGEDLTNRLSFLMLAGATNLALPEPLVWVRWHPALDPQFFDDCLARLAHSTCFPMYWNDVAVSEALIALGIARDDAFAYVPVGCNELAIPGQMYFNPGAHAAYLPAIEAALTDGRGYQGQWQWRDVAPPARELLSFDQFAAAVGAYLRRGIEQSYAVECQMLAAQMRWGQTPLTSCFFPGCLERGSDLTAGTRYNILTCGGIAFANAVDSLAAIRHTVYDRREATLADVSTACAANYVGHERLHAQLLAAPKHGNDRPELEDIIALVERLRDDPVKELCRDPRDGTPMGNGHVVRSGAVTGGLTTPATPDGRLAGTPLASSIAAAVGCERSGPTAVLNSVCQLNGPQSWQCGYQVNLRFHAGMVQDEAARRNLQAMLNVYFARGGQELQINVVSTQTLRAAQQHPELYRDLVVRIAGFSEFFVRLTPEMQEDIIARTEHQ